MTLAPGQTASCTAAIVFLGEAGATQTDVVTVTARDDEGTLTSASDDATITLSTTSAVLAPRPSKGG